MEAFNGEIRKKKPTRISVERVFSSTGYSLKGYFDRQRRMPVSSYDSPEGIGFSSQLANQNRFAKTTPRRFFRRAVRVGHETERGGDGGTTWVEFFLMYGVPY